MMALKRKYKYFVYPNINNNPEYKKAIYLNLTSPFIPLRACPALRDKERE
jgi:hypothetical protein